MKENIKLSGISLLLGIYPIAMGLVVYVSVEKTFEKQTSYLNIERVMDERCGGIGNWELIFPDSTSTSGTWLCLDDKLH